MKRDAQWAAVTMPLFLLIPALALGQSGPSLPVYQVTQSGALPPQATSLANSLNVPVNAVVLTNGEVDFHDPTNFMRVPTLPVTNTSIIDTLLAQTPNRFPGIPLSFEQLDFSALSNLTVLSSNAAVTAFGTALANAGLASPLAAPVVTHTVLMATYTNGPGQILSSSNLLDTKVSYQYSLGGYPLIGPGAQVQADFGPDGNVTRLLYAARQLSPGPMVNIISPAEASNRVVAPMPGFNGQVSIQLVYYAPPLSLTTVASIIPWYLCEVSTAVTNPTTGAISMLNLLPQLIPATDDTNYVPMLNLVANPGNGSTQVVASASVTGGVPPYTYIWSGSGTNAYANNGPQLNYTPVVQVAAPQLSFLTSAPGLISLSWADPTGLFRLQSSSNLHAGTWSPVAGNQTTSNGVTSTTLNLNVSSVTFFRLVLSNSFMPVTENVELEIVDANGVVVRQAQSVPAYAVVSPIGVVVDTTLLIGWGTESPYDQDIGDADTAAWLGAMRGNPLFGTERYYHGTYSATPSDFLEPPYGNDEQLVDSVDLVFYIGHGNPNAISFTELSSGPSQPGVGLYDSETIGAWGDGNLEWLCLLSCDVLDNGQFFTYPSFRWGPSFDGLHFMLGFSTEAASGHTTFEPTFVGAMAAPVGPVMSIQKSWFLAAKAANVGAPAVLGPIGPGGVCDVNDYWWGMGPVGPRIRSSQIQGWYYLTESN